MQRLRRYPVLRQLVLAVLTVALAGALAGCNSLFGNPPEAGGGDDNGDTQDDDSNNGGGSDPADVAAPTFSLERGQYVGSQTLEISSDTDGAEIYYTFGYDEPTTDDQRYTGAITIDSTTTVSAVALRDSEVSDQVVATYAIREAGYTNLIANGGFSEGTAGWYLHTNDAADASFTTADGDGDTENELAVTINDGGEDSFHVQAMFDVGVPTVEGDFFMLTFTAWFEPSSSASHDLGITTLRIDDFGEDMDGDGSAFEAYFYRKDVWPTTPKTFEIPVAIYHSPDHNHPRTRLAFDLGSEEGFTQAGTAYIDDVALEPIETPAAYADVVTNPAMRAAVLESIREARDTDTGATRFSGITESEVTAYHVAAIDQLDIEPYHFTDAGFSAADFDLSQIDGGAAGRLNSFETSDIPLSNDDFASIMSLQQIRWIEIDGSTGNGTGSGITDISSLANLARLGEFSFERNPVSPTNLAATLTPANFPSIRNLRLGLGYYGSVTTEDADTLVGIFTAFGDAGQVFERVGMSNAGISDSQFLTLFNDVIANGPDELEALALSGNANPGQLTNAVTDEIGTLTGLERIELEGQSITDVSELGSLPELRDLDLEGLAVADIAGLSGLGNVYGIDLEATEITDIAPLQDMLNAGSFADGGYIDLTNNSSLTMAAGTPNGDALAALEAAGVVVQYDESQLVETATSIHTVASTDIAVDGAVSDWDSLLPQLYDPEGDDTPDA